MADITPGDIVSGLDPGELVEIQRIAPFGSKMLVEGAGVQSRRIITRPLTLEEIGKLVKIRGAQFTYEGDAQLFLLEPKPSVFELLISSIPFSQ